MGEMNLREDQIVEIIAKVFSEHSETTNLAKEAAREIRRREGLFVASYNAWND